MDDDDEDDDRHVMIRNSITTRSHQEIPSFRPPSSSTVAPIQTAGTSNVRIDTDDDDDDEIWTLSKAYQSAQVTYTICTTITTVMVGFWSFCGCRLFSPHFRCSFFHSRLLHMYMNIYIYIYIYIYIG
jgi:hypothetical protein